MSLISVISFFNTEVLSSPRAFMHSPRVTARNTMASTEVLLEKVAATLDGTTLKITFNGLAPVDPACPSRPSTWMLKRPAL